ncbi:hypothetical protein V4R08_08400 [Nitrobacter sp. NHB1]|uniref:hypothetical protein n=1 Tax=Nitrobacter sp. NHB1 TaxID=3119830 RepID=UPI002FFF0DC9
MEMQNCHNKIVISSARKNWLLRSMCFGFAGWLTLEGGVETVVAQTSLHASMATAAASLEASPISGDPPLPNDMRLRGHQIHFTRMGLADDAVATGSCEALRFLFDRPNAIRTTQHSASSYLIKFPILFESLRSIRE